MIIDWWSLAIQAVNVTVLIWLLGRFFWRPVAQTIAQRRAIVQRDLAAATAARDKADAALRGVDLARAGIARERETVLAEARAAAARERAAALDAATLETAALRAKAETELTKARAEAEAAWRQRAGELSVDIARRLLARVEEGAVREAFLGWLARELQALPDSTRQALAHDDGTLEVVTTGTLTPDEEGHCRRLVANALGAGKVLTFRPDPALIAGLELHGRFLTIRNSWRADLARILAELADDR